MLWENLLKYTDIVVADKRKYRIETNEEHYLHAHPREQLMFVKQSDRNAAQEKTVYYTLDNVNFNESQELIKKQTT